MTLLSVCWNIPRFFELQTCYIFYNETLNYSIENNTVTETHSQSNFSIFLSKMSDSEEEESLLPQVCATELRENFQYCRDYMLVANFLMMAFIPFLTLAIFNGLTFRKIVSSSRTNTRTSKRQERDHTIAMMLSCVVLVFFICSSGRIVLNLWEVREQSL